MFGLLFCKHFKELGGKVKDGVHGRAIPIGNVPFFEWDSRVVGFGWMWIWWVLMYGNEQKVGGRGCEGFRPFVGRRVG